MFWKCAILTICKTVKSMHRRFHFLARLNLNFGSFNLKKDLAAWKVYQKDFLRPVSLFTVHFYRSLNTSTLMFNRPFCCLGPNCLISLYSRLPKIDTFLVPPKIRKFVAQNRPLWPDHGLFWGHTWKCQKFFLLFQFLFVWKKCQKIDPCLKLLENLPMLKNVRKFP